jgi:hypothetical protein
MAHPDSAAALEEATLDLFRELARQVDSCTKEQVDTANTSYTISLAG